MNRCTKCGVEQPAVNYYKGAGTRDGLRGLTVEQYDQMLIAQGGGCAICGRPPRDDIALHVDHDHSTGAIRGLTCFRCNNALGDLNDDPDLLERASAYLDRHNPESEELRALAKRRVRELASTMLF